MSVVQDKRFEPVEGDVVETSLLKTLGTLVMFILFIPVGAWAAWAWWTEASLLGYKFTPIVGLGGVLFALLGLVGVPATIALMFRKPRLIVGEDRLQHVTKQGRVLTQIPYRNIERVELTRGPEKEKFIGIDLKDPSDPETLNTDSEKTKRWTGWHHRITKSGWLLPLEQIHDLLQRRLERARAKG
jgi:hypothetical protein